MMQSKVAASAFLFLAPVPQTSQVWANNYQQVACGIDWLPFDVWSLYQKKKFMCEMNM